MKCAAQEKELPDLRRAGIIALDTETNDEGLRADRGAAWPWRGGYVCGVSVAYRADSGIRAHYLPIRHPDSQNFDPARVFDWWKDLVASDVRVVTQNGLYDWGWLRADADIRMPPAERLEETQAAATIVDENRPRYSLDALCKWRGLLGKDDALLLEGCAALGLIPKGRKKFIAQEHIWRLPARYVDTYAKADAINTLALFESLSPILDQEGTRDAYRLEVDLLPMVHEMRRRGIRINVPAAEQARDRLIGKRNAVLAELSEKLGVNVGMDELNRAAWRAKVFDQHGVSYPRTDKGNPSFTAGNSGWMPKHPHWLPQLIVQADKLTNYGENFLETYILGHVVNGRVHAEIHPHRGDDGSGTRSLRFSYSSPPLQLMPKHDEELAPLIRGVFLPEEGEVWASADLSQQEFRFIVHYAARHKLRKAAEAVELYRSNPDTDFHLLVAQWTGRERSVSKNVNFAKAFGAGVRKFAAMIGIPESEARVLYKQYDRELPFVAQLSKLCEREAQRTGYLALYDGARRHFNLWAPGGKWEKGAGPCELEEAKRRRANPEHAWFKYPLARADAYKAMNALIQGSAARHTKLWMRACWREGIVPLLQLHDALECSVRSPEQTERVAQLGREAVTLEVPMQVDLKYGRNWGDTKHTWEALTGITAPRASEPIPARQSSASSAPEPEIRQQFSQTPLPRASTDGKICCPFHDDKTPSCQLYDDGHYHCFGCGKHGWIDDDLDVDAAALTKLAASSTEDDIRKLERALELWDAGKPIAGTLAARYLSEVRKIDLVALPASIDQVLRFHPRCPFGLGVRHPCLIALMRNPMTDEATGIHRTALTPEGRKIDRRMLGCRGAAKLWPIGTQLVVGEGLETVLAAATRFPYRDAPLQPAWALLNAGALGWLPVLPEVERLIILADNDLNGIGQTAARTCAMRWTRAGRSVVCLTPNRADTDFNDLVIMREAAP
jgi:DNA polymerase I-like protein with 3'-5' exonuclease and polymerase domains